MFIPRYLPLEHLGLDLRRKTIAFGYKYVAENVILSLRLTTPRTSEMADQSTIQFDDTPSGRDASNRLESPIHSEKSMRIIIIGAGASGLLLAYKLQKDFQNINFIVYEKNADVAGTWYENRYPG